MDETDHTQSYNRQSNPKPDRIARTKVGHGKNANFETIGMVWSRDDGSEYVKPYGKQVIDQGFYIFDLNNRKDDEPSNPME